MSTTRASLPSARDDAGENARRRARERRADGRAVASPTIVVKDGRDPETTMNGLSRKRREVIEDMTAFAAGELSTLLKDPDTNWQPQDWLPNPESPDFLDQVRAREGARERARGRGLSAGRSNEERARDARRETREEGRGGGGGRRRGETSERAVTDERANASRS